MTGDANTQVVGMVGDLNTNVLVIMVRVNKKVRVCDTRTRAPSCQMCGYMGSKGT